MQRTCANCGFENSRLPRAAVCPKCLRHYPSRPALLAVPVRAVVAVGMRVARLLAIALAAVVALLACTDWLSERGTERQTRDNKAAALLERDKQAELQEAIAGNRVVIGMRADEVRRAWGEPTSINTSTYASGVQEQWVYRWSNGQQQFVYIANGAVRSIQTVGG